MAPEDFADRRKHVQTDFGRISYIDAGKGPAALFVHGYPLNGFHWSAVMEQLADERHCLAPDLLGLGYTEPEDGVALDFPTQADMLLAFLDALGIDQVDLVGNDSGTAIAQLLAVKAPRRIRTLCLTNGDAHDNYPPKPFEMSFQLARAGKLGETVTRTADNPDALRSPQALGSTCQFPERLSDDILALYFSPIVSTPERRALIDRYVGAMDNRQMTAIRDDLAKLDIPALIVWADSDVFFSTDWGEWLAETLPNSRLEILKDAKLFFPAERADELCELLRDHWRVREAA